MAETSEVNSAVTARPSPIPSTTATTKNVDSAVFLKPSSPLKRRRSPEQSRKSPAPLTPKLSAALATPHLTIAAEMEAKRRKLDQEKSTSQATSPNAQSRVLGELSEQQSNGMSRPEDAPTQINASNQSSAPAVPAITIPTQTHGEGSLQTSPVSISSHGTMDSNGISAMNVGGMRTVSPGAMEDEGASEDRPQPHSNNNLRVEDEGLSNKAFSYPGPQLPATSEARRNMSLPGSASKRDDSRSPSSANKKHKCPYCDTEFTRQHNLKSHLLTHSHERPYLCQTCDSRFRRLHDLKRHTKLHTGEKPHICPKCNRRFARGDALARHAKGQGGCAGRRSSVGSYGEGGVGDSMDGMMYGNDMSHDPEHLDEDGSPTDIRGDSLPSIRHHDAQDPHQYRQDSGSYPINNHANRTPSTYPPVAARAPMGGLYPPNAGAHGGVSSSTTSPGLQASSLSHSFMPNPAAYHQNSYPNPHGAMTESPKPLSPGSNQIGQPARTRTTSLSQKAQQNQFGRNQQARGASPPPSGFAPPGVHSNAPQLPSLAGLNPPDPRYTLPSQAPPQPPHNTHNPSYPPVGSSASNSLSSHGTNQQGSGDRTGLHIVAEERLWAVVRGLEAKVDRLQEEVVSLRGQLAQAQAQAQRR
jgi:hypothetical protein